MINLHLLLESPKGWTRLAELIGAIQSGASLKQINTNYSVLGETKTTGRKLLILKAQN